MKNKGTLLVFLVLLTACSTKEYRVIPEENSAIVVEQDESQENVTEDKIDSDKDTQAEELTANQYIEFNYDKAGVTTCLKEQDLKAGESRQCVYIYSYAGIGEYFIALSINVADNKWANYLLNVMNVSEKE